MLYAGYDIGGTKCAVSVGRVENGGIEVLGKARFLTSGTPYDVMDSMVEELSRLLGKLALSFSDIAAAGISCGGPLNSRDGIILSPPNLPNWDNIHITEYLYNKTGIETKLQNDANACAVAEWLFGAGKGARNMAFLTFGTGLGAGLILDGKLYCGASDMAGEIGHVRLSEDGPEGYGKRGSAEGYCSGGGIGRLARSIVSQSIENGEKPALYEAAGGDIEKIDAKLTAELAFKGDEMCKSIYSECGTRLGRALSLLIDIINPEIIVLGGVFMRSEALIRPSMEAEIKKEALYHAYTACKIVPAGLGESVGDFAALSVAAL